MKRNSIKIVSALVLIALFAFSVIEETTQIRCMIQLKNYTGEGAYLIISLMNPEGQYEKTLYVQGEDTKWYHEVDEWWGFYGKRKTNLDGITGATIAGGERSIREIKIPTDKINQGYSLRFETSVEDVDYFPKDIEFPLTTENLTSKKEGIGFIRYVRLLEK